MKPDDQSASLQGDSAYDIASFSAQKKKKIYKLDKLWLLRRNHVPTHNAPIISKFPAERNIDVPEHGLYSLDLAPYRGYEETSNDRAKGCVPKESFEQGIESWERRI